MLRYSKENTFSGTLDFFDAIDSGKIDPHRGDSFIFTPFDRYYVEGWRWYTFEGLITPNCECEGMTEEQLLEEMKLNGYYNEKTGWRRLAYDDFLRRPMWYCYNERTGMKFLLCK